MAVVGLETLSETALIIILVELWPAAKVMLLVALAVYVPLAAVPPNEKKTVKGPLGSPVRVRTNVALVGFPYVLAWETVALPIELIAVTPTVMDGRITEKPVGPLALPVVTVVAVNPKVHS